MECSIHQTKNQRLLTCELKNHSLTAKQKGTKGDILGVLICSPLIRKHSPLSTQQCGQHLRGKRMQCVFVFQPGQGFIIPSFDTCMLGDLFCFHVNWNRLLWALTQTFSTNSQLLFPQPSGKRVETSNFLSQN